MESAPVLMHATKPQRGFTMVELLVVLAIIAIVTVISVTGQSSFNRSLILSDTAYGVAFSAREAQTFGLSSKGYNSQNNVGYGLHFDSAALGQYIFFADIDNSLANASTNCPVGVQGTPSAKLGDCIYNPSANTTELITKSVFTRGIKIQKFCGKTVSGLSCSDTGLTTLDIVFTRPNTTTTISGLVGASRTAFYCAQITLTDSEGAAQRTVRISQQGEIAVNQPCP